MFRYCPHCRRPIKPHHKLYECPCGFHFYINPAPCAIALLTNLRGELLFVVRGKAPRKGYLDLPGGFLEQGESAEQGIARELKEELGVVPKKLTYFASYPDRYLYNNINYHVVSSVFIGEVSEREAKRIKAADDVNGIEWHPFLSSSGPAAAGSRPRRDLTRGSRNIKLPKSRFAFPSMKTIVKDLRELKLK